MSDTVADFALMLSDLLDDVDVTVSSFEQILLELYDNEDAYCDRDDAIRLGFNIASLSAHMLLAVRSCSMLLEVRMPDEWQDTLQEAIDKALAMDREETAIEAVQRRIDALRDCRGLLVKLQGAWGRAATAIDGSLLGEADFQALLEG